MKFILILIGGLAASVIWGTSAAMNACFINSFTTTVIAGWIAIAVVVALDVAKVSIPLLVHKHNYWMKCVMWLVCIALAVISIFSVMGFILTQRTDIAAQRTAKASVQDSIDARLSQDRKRLDAVEGYRDPAIFEALISKQLSQYQKGAGTVVKLTGNCNPKNRWTPRSTACRKVQDLRIDLARAKAGEALRAQIVEGEAKLSTLDIVGEGDVQASTLARVLGVDTVDAQRALVGIFALLIEIVSVFGFRWLIETPSASAELDSPELPHRKGVSRVINVVGFKRGQSRVKPHLVEGIDAYVNARLSRVAGSRVQASKLYEDYKFWARGSKIVSNVIFARRLEELGFTKREIGGRRIYDNVELSNVVRGNAA